MYSLSFFQNPTSLAFRTHPLVARFFRPLLLAHSLLKGSGRGEKGVMGNKVLKALSLNGLESGVNIDLQVCICSTSVRYPCLDTHTRPLFVLSAHGPPPFAVRAGAVGSERQVRLRRPEQASRLPASLRRQAQVVCSFAIAEAAHMLMSLTALLA